MTRAVAGVTVTHYVELDGSLVASGRRLLDLSSSEILAYVWAWLLDGRDAASRKRLIDTIMGRVGSSGGAIVQDEAAPERLRGREAPEWWGSDDDPHFEPFPMGGLSM